VDAFSPQARALFDQMRAGFVARGSDAVTAMEQARAALFGMIQREAMMLSFTDIFRWLALLFVAMVPLLLLMRSPRSRKSAAGAH
jgi:DHA2 family multidrug resistance protein